MKPSYNPFTRKEPPKNLEGTGDINHMHSHTGRTAEPAPYEQQTEHVPVTEPTAAGTTAAASGRASEYPEEKHDRHRLHKDPPADHPAAQHGTTTGESHEALTGLPYDPSKDSQTAARLGEHHHGPAMGEGTSSARRLEHEEQSEEHHKGLGEKLKEKFGRSHH